MARDLRHHRAGGKIGVITNHDSLDATPLRAKSVSLYWEDVVTRMAFGAPADLIAHHRILDEVTSLVDAGLIRSTATKELRPINAASLREGHSLVESGRMFGKVVMGEFLSLLAKLRHRRDGTALEGPRRPSIMPVLKHIAWRRRQRSRLSRFHSSSTERLSLSLPSSRTQEPLPGEAFRIYLPAPSKIAILAVIPIFDDIFSHS